jgi:hypothetical protein
MVFTEYNRLKNKAKADKDVVEYLSDRLDIINDKIDSFYRTMTI